eukprot:gnl/Hemi2/16505_TR5515_c0_g2_i2.p1 gnl/Hemi2/16505_TR5515_c0_g2~~gnl/Hemi2/16505_TR5515_c0_g2_i2.p1  ORF type:complete len:203 (+),score=26.20 gnl/Hemi2/16505_TR5515_c0_g2_i2:87-695(+)
MQALQGGFFRLAVKVLVLLLAGLCCVCSVDGALDTVTDTECDISSSYNNVEADTAYKDLVFDGNAVGRNGVHFYNDILDDSKNVGADSGIHFEVHLHSARSVEGLLERALRAKIHWMTATQQIWSMAQSPDFRTQNHTSQATLQLEKKVRKLESENELLLDLLRDTEEREKTCARQLAHRSQKCPSFTCLDTTAFALFGGPH